MHHVDEISDSTHNENFSRKTGSAVRRTTSVVQCVFFVASGIRQTFNQNEQVDKLSLSIVFIGVSMPHCNASLAAQDTATPNSSALPRAVDPVKFLQLTRPAMVKIPLKSPRIRISTKIECFVASEMLHRCKKFAKNSRRQLLDLSAEFYTNASPPNG